MVSPWMLEGESIILSKPELGWECRGFKVNEGPTVLARGDKLFVSYSASAADKNYCMGLLWIDWQADPPRSANWRETPQPIFRTSYENRQYGPGYNSFTQTPAKEDVLVCHIRNYTRIESNPLYGPSRYMRLKLVSQREDRVPDFGIPPADTLQWLETKLTDAGSAGRVSATHPACKIPQGMRRSRLSAGPGH